MQDIVRDPAKVVNIGVVGEHRHRRLADGSFIHDKIGITGSIVRRLVCGYYWHGHGYSWTLLTRMFFFSIGSFTRFSLRVK
jgi:hypothetical protein